MNSIEDKSLSFSMEYFEKGLMLAGLIPPNNISELNERNILEEYEKALKNESRINYFKRAVLAAEIAAELSNEATFGRIKFQKLVYLCEHAVNMNVQGRYTKQVAGPFDSKFMHSIEQEFKKQKWFEVEKIKEGNISRSKYKPLPDCNNYKKYFNTYFGLKSDNVRYVIDLFRKAKTDTTEIAATLHACALELRQNNEMVTEEKLLNLFYNWSVKKERFDEKTVLSIWKWINEKALI
jgi:hypothetical protein